MYTWYVDKVLREFAKKEIVMNTGRMYYEQRIVCHPDLFRFLFSSVGFNAICPSSSLIWQYETSAFKTVVTQLITESIVTLATFRCRHVEHHYFWTLNVFHSIVLDKIYLCNTVKHNCFNYKPGYRKSLYTFIKTTCFDRYSTTIKSTKSWICDVQRICLVRSGIPLCLHCCIKHCKNCKIVMLRLAYTN